MELEKPDEYFTKNDLVTLSIQETICIVNVISHDYKGLFVREADGSIWHDDGEWWSKISD